MAPGCSGRPWPSSAFWGRGPRPAGVSIIDHHGAALFAVGILAALVRRGRTGQGCRVDASLMHAALDLQAESFVAWLNAPVKPVRHNAPQHVAGWYYSAPYGVYATKDGHLAVSIAPLTLIAEALDAPHIARWTDANSWSRKEEIGDEIAAVLRQRPTGEWIARLEALKIWHAPVQGYAEIAGDPAVSHGRALVAGKGAGRSGAPGTLVNHPVQYDGQVAEMRLPPQPLGGQNGEVLAELGYSAAEIAALAKDGVVRLAYA